MTVCSASLIRSLNFTLSNGDESLFSFAYLHTWEKWDIQLKNVSYLSNVFSISDISLENLHSSLRILLCKAYVLWFSLHPCSELGLLSTCTWYSIDTWWVLLGYLVAVRSIVIFSLDTFTVYSQYTKIFYTRMLQEHFCKLNVFSYMHKQVK